jgi:hypothetical protein
MIWLRRVGMFLDYKFTYSTDSDCTELLDVFSPAVASDIKNPLKPFAICATKQKIEQYKYRLGFINITEIGEAQAMMEMSDMNTSPIYMMSAQISCECTWIQSFGINNTISKVMLFI